ncbi:hypothetical protein predicted by Glimmer/Critica [Sorangium cellulosum So ce56]|uniref:Uncharacterized protein n=2 Tax=Sorangium cellulosum TaxID=56 RepID=A9GDM7_SORC5|nr:hypothetical protein predicted by Glimmer/Critica [Sorangium cellulosum So ce56]
MSGLPRLPELAERLVLAAQDASPAVRLVGGSGLALLLDHRRSDDLDLFCGLREDVEPIVRTLEAAAAASSVGVTRVDLVDLFFIDRAGFPILQGFEDALKKDSGMDPAWFAWAVSQIELKPLRGMVVPLPEQELEAFKESLRRGALDRAGAGESV